VSIDDPDQLRGLQRAGKLVADTIRALCAAIAPGRTTGQLDAIAANLMRRAGARSGPIMTYGYPGHICVSVGDEVVHGIPGDRILAQGEIVTVDVALELDGFHADAATTVPVGPDPDAPSRDVIRAARAALAAGIDAARPGSRLSDVGAAVQQAAERHHVRVIRELTGHGIGLAMHEPPTVFNYPERSADLILTPGLVFTIEPMLSARGARIYTDDDGWTIRTVDGSLSAHEEHTIVVSASGPPLVVTR
jgi:methionyl aminopeptidase